MCGAWDVWWGQGWGDCKGCNIVYFEFGVTQDMHILIESVRVFVEVRGMH